MTLQRTLLLASACVIALVVSPSAAAEAEPVRWCAPEFEALTDSVCYADAPQPDGGGAASAADEQAPAPSQPSDSNDSAAPKPHGTLVIFLHSLVEDRSKWQWEQQRAIARAMKTFVFSVLMPRGRLGIGPGRAQDVWAWPTSPAMQEQHEATLIDEWLALKQTVERRRGPFAEVFVFGFSNGAYYAASLALRGRLPVQGYAVFAGGSGGKYMRLLGSRTKERAPVFVGYGTKDPAHRGQEALVALLRDLDWKHRSKPAPVGHTVTDAQLAAAARFLHGP